jgi:hypothetical protein
MKAYDAIDEKWLEGARDSVSTGFERQLINSVMGFGGECAALAGFEVHHVVAHPAESKSLLTMMSADLLS